MPASNLWPPPYHIRKSKQAKRVFLRITLHGGLEVVVPDRWPSINIEALLDHHRPWVEENWHRFPTNFQAPDTITLHAINACYTLIYQASVKAITCQADHLLIPDVPKQELQNILCIWLIRQAYRILNARLITLSAQTALPYQNLHISKARTIWGSCSAKGRISLSFKLIFLPPYLVDYVILHELCHTVELNHSAAFWSLLTQFDPLAKQHDKQLRHVTRWVPAWVLARPYRDD